MKKFEYATTEADLSSHSSEYGSSRDAPYPDPPPGDGWDLKAAVVHDRFDRVLWFWQREKPEEPKPAKKRPVPGSGKVRPDV